MTDWTTETARAAVAALKRGALSPHDLIDLTVARHGAVDGAVNALPTLCVERARAQADRILDGTHEGDRDHPGWLAGLPVVIKDLTDVAGVRTTYGSPAFADHVAMRSDIMVETLEQRGAVVIAKSNTPEFGAGAQTFNEVFGKTRNPWNTARTCGGSSGGSAVALATGQAWLATGSDLGGSLRIPAAFCSVVGLRPAPGRVARGPVADPMNDLSVEGPLGRTVGDVALLLDAMAGRHAGDPSALPRPATPFSAARPERPGRVAFSPDLGVGPVDPAIATATAAAAAALSDAGWTVEAAAPDLSGARDAFQTLRAAKFAQDLQPVLDTHRAALKPEVIWNIEKGLALTADEIARATAAREAIVARTAAFFDTYDLLICPATIVPPFDVDQRYVEAVGDHRFETYIDWLSITFAITLTRCPALSLPCGFTADGLPVGLQMVGRPLGEAGLLSAALAAEAVFGLAGRVPIDPMTP